MTAAVILMVGGAAAQARGAGPRLVAPSVPVWNAVRSALADLASVESGRDPALRLFAKVTQGTAPPARELFRVKLPFVNGAIFEIDPALSDVEGLLRASFRPRDRSGSGQFRDTGAIVWDPSTNLPVALEMRPSDPWSSEVELWIRAEFGVVSGKCIVVREIRGGRWPATGPRKEFRVTRERTRRTQDLAPPTVRGERQTVGDHA